MEPEEKPGPPARSAELVNPVPALALVAGQKADGGRYTLLRFLGQGGMGVVWLARDEHLHDDVALKFLPANIHHDVEALEDMRRETLKSRKLSHPNIIRIHDLHVRDGEAPFISMEYIDGEPLNALKSKQPQRFFTWEFLKPILKQLCAALDYAHQQKVIHRDLKPANMMLTREGILKLADFGIAAVVSDSMSRVSLKHATSGTLLYMSPQQIDGRRPTPADDIYALGATMYELLTSKAPFYTGDILHQVRRIEPQPPAERLACLELTNAIPPDVAALVMACLSKDPAIRPPSAGAVAEWIGLNTATEPSTPIFTAPQPALPEEDLEPTPALQIKSSIRAPAAPGQGRGKTGWWIAIGVVGALLWGWGGLWWLSDRGKPPTPSTKAGAAGAGKTGTSNEVAAPALASMPAAAPPAFQATARRWTNSLGLVMVPVPGTDVNFSIWLTRVQDFEAFVRATKYDATKGMMSFQAGKWKQLGDHWKSPGFAQGPTHPVCGVSWDDAQAFCKWLTEKERGEGRLTTTQSYRLPLDWEWSVAVGLSEGKGGTPSSKSGKIERVYPWGTQWPPPSGAGNYAKDYKVDSFDATSPVGNFTANAHGLYDMGGNLWQWCEDQHEANPKVRTLRGASWYTGGEPLLRASIRSGNNTWARFSDLGFRVVLGESAR